MDEKIVKDSQCLVNDLANDCISRKAAIDAVMRNACNTQRIYEAIKGLPSAQPEPSEITDEQAIMHLQSIGWMQNHDREMYESGLRERLADDSEDYNSLIPCEDTISRQAAIAHAVPLNLFGREVMIVSVSELENLPSAQPEQRWIPCSERLPEEKDAGILKKLGTEKRSEYVLATVDVKGERTTVTACTYDGKWDWNMKYAFPDYKVVAWMPLPEPYKGDDK